MADRLASISCDFWKVNAPPSVNIYGQSLGEKSHNGAHSPEVIFIEQKIVSLHKYALEEIKYGRFLTKVSQLQRFRILFPMMEISGWVSMSLRGPCCHLVSDGHSQEARRGFTTSRNRKIIISSTCIQKIVNQLKHVTYHKLLWSQFLSYYFHGKPIKRFF